MTRVVSRTVSAIERTSANPHCRVAPDYSCIRFLGDSAPKLSLPRITNQNSSRPTDLASATSAELLVITIIILSSINIIIIIMTLLLLLLLLLFDPFLLYVGCWSNWRDIVQCHFYVLLFVSRNKYVLTVNSWQWQQNWLALWQSWVSYWDFFDICCAWPHY